MEQLAYYAFWTGFVASSIGALLYIGNAIGSWTTYRVAATNVGTVNVPVSLPFPRGIGVAATVTAHAALLALILSVAFRAAAAGRPPLGNLWEFTVAFGAGIVLFSVISEWVFKQRTVSAFVMPVAVALMLIAILYFPHELRPLVPALQANRILGIHVSVMLLAYSAFSVSFGAAVMYLLQFRSGGGKRFAGLPDVDVLDDAAYWSVIIGFPLLLLGLVLGAWWANNAWGRYWGWDPKETSALMTWLVYAFYLHTRGLRGWSGRRSAVVLLVGFVGVLFTYFAVNFWISGLHSYAGV